MGERIYQGGCIEFYTEWVDRAKALKNPTVLSLQVKKPDGTDYYTPAKAIGDWTPLSTGVYSFMFQSDVADAVGAYIVIAKGTVDNKVDPRVGVLEIIALP